MLLLAATTGYQTRSFADAAGRLGVELVFVTDRCHVLDDPWRDAAVPVRFHQEAGSARAVVEALRERPVAGLLVLGDRPAVIGALVARELDLPWHRPDGAAASRDKRRGRERLAQAGLPVPWFADFRIDDDPRRIASTVPLPCVVKPLALSGSRGVMRASSPAEFVQAFDRLRRLLLSPPIREMRDPANDVIMIESFVSGQEFAVEGVLDRGRLKVLAVFDKPDPLDGPFFEETIYVTPSRLPVEDQQRIVEAIEQAAATLGLWHGPVHAECRLNERGVYILEVAARPIGGLCARALRFDVPGSSRDRLCSLEELLLLHALGEPVARYEREPCAAGVMMIPIPRGGVYRRVDGLEAAILVPGVEDIQVTAKADQQLVPLPEGSSYLGFIFARAATAAEAEQALREAHARLGFVIEPALPVV